MGFKTKFSLVEKEARIILEQFDSGEIDNPWDIYDCVMDIEKRLPTSSSLRDDWDSLFDECQRCYQSR